MNQSLCKHLSELIWDAQTVMIVFQHHVEVELWVVKTGAGISPSVSDPRTKESYISPGFLQASLRELREFLPPSVAVQTFQRN